MDKVVGTFTKRRDSKSFDKNVHYDNIFNNYFVTTIPTDYLKLVIIVILLIASGIIFNYEPPKIIRRVNHRPVPMNRTQTKGTINNPHGFHAFYQVHERVKYKNPTMNACDGIDPSRTILLAILSRASNVHIREAIRQTWGSIRIYNEIEIRLTFIVGVDDGMIRQIEIEQSIYHGKQ